MPAAAWPQVQDRLVQLLPTLPGWADVDVTDGPPREHQVPFKYCTVGSTVFDDFGGSYEQTRDTDSGWDTSVLESGQVRCELVVATDLDDEDRLTSVAAVRQTAFGLVNTMDAALVEDPTLGGALAQLTTVSLSTDVQPMQTDQGAVQRLLITVSYSTHL